MNDTEALLIALDMRQQFKDGRAVDRRTAAGLSRREAAEPCHFSESALRHWENRERRPRLEAALRYAEFLNAIDGGPPSPPGANGRGSGGHATHAQAVPA